jgi:hypothetical protein
VIALVGAAAILAVGAALAISCASDYSVVGANAEAGAPIGDSGVALADAGAAAAACAQGACLVAPPGWDLVAFGDAAVACPSGLDSEDVVEDPKATPTTCACSDTRCTILSVPSCSSGSAPSTYDNGPAATCNLAGLATELGDGGCFPLSGQLGTHASVAAPAPAGTGQCSATAAPNDGGVDYGARRICTGPCNGVCDPSLAGSFVACLRHAGVEPCPSAAPKQHLVGTNVNVSCGGCACSVTSACAGTITFYSDSQCKNELLALDSGACAAANGAMFKSYTWAGHAAGTACHASNPEAGAVALTDTETICCP